MSDALEDNKSSVCIGGRIFINFRFADDMVVNAEEEGEADDIVTIMNITCTRCKTKIITNNPNGFQRQINIKGQD